jgi:tripartite-type tricarboxylate transporter receptor subunit TctC
MAFFDSVLLANSGSQFGTVKDVLAFAKANPGKLNIGHISIGSTQSLIAELFKTTAGIEALAVPFKATPAVVSALRSNDLHVAVEFLGPVMGQIKNGSLRALAVMSTRRFPGLPDVPTIVEAGMPAFQASSWNGVSVRAKTPPEIVARLNKEIVAAVNAPEVQKRMLDLGAVARSTTPEEMRALMIAEIAKWKAVIERANIPKQ